jgi:hypothetical protein
MEKAGLVAGYWGLSLIVAYQIADFAQALVLPKVERKVIGLAKWGD